MAMHGSSRRRITAGVTALASFAAGTAFMVGAFPGTASADESPEHIPGNPDCQDLGYPNEFKIDQAPADGVLYEVGSAGVQTKGDVTGFTVTVDYSSQAPPVFGFSSSIAVDAVLVKAGPGSNAYLYEPATTSASGLTSPEGKDISHVTFCWDDEDGGNGGTTTTTMPDGEQPPTTPPGEEPGGEEPGGEEPPTVAPPATPVTGEPGFTG